MSRIDNNYFTYRETPTTENGTGTLVDIKGQTIKWNQLVQNGNFASTSGWTVYQPANASINANSNVLTETLTISTLTQGNAYTIGLQKTNVISDATHKYLCFVTITLSFTSNVRIELGGSAVLGTNPINANTKTTLSVVSTAFTYNKNLLIYPQSGVVGIDLSGQTIKYENIMLIDLTLMFGAGNEPTAVDEFTSLFPLSYYPYNSGSLIPFMGNGIKTVGFNQWDEEWEAGTLNSDGSTSSASNRIITSYVPVLTNIAYSMTIPYNGRGRGAFYDENKHLIEYFYDFPVSGRNDVFPRDGLISSVGNNYCFSFIPPAGTAFVRYNTISAYGGTYENNICINISDTERNGTYEPYTSHTTNLPVSTYFPTGMKSAGNVYDELTESKAISRVGSVDLGTLTWNHVNSGGSNGYWQAGTGSIPNAKYISNYSGINIKGINPVDGSVIQSVGVYQMDGATVSKIGISQNGSANYQNASATVAPTGILYYELATPIETAISPELDLTFNIDKGGTEELLPSGLLNGSVDLGSLTWRYESGWRAFVSTIVDAKRVASSLDANWFCSRYILKGSHFSGDSSADMTIDLNSTAHGDGTITIRDTSFNGDATAFTNSLQGVYLWYETTDSTPTTTPILCDILYRGLIPVSVTVYPLGAGTVEGAGQYRYGETVTLVAESSDGIYRFLRYEDENGDTLSTDSTYSFIAGE